jgi:hypothetical protein
MFANAAGQGPGSVDKFLNNQDSGYLLAFQQSVLCAFWLKDEYEKGGPSDCFAGVFHTSRILKKGIDSGPR